MFLFFSVVIAKLLSKGAQINETNKTGLSPLAYALFRGRLTLAKDFLSRGAKLSPDISIRIYSHAITFGRDQLFSFLLNHNIKPPNLTLKDGENLLHLACRYGRKAMIEQLILHGVDCNHRQKIKKHLS